MQVDWNPKQHVQSGRVGPHWPDANPRRSESRYRFFRNVNRESVLEAYRFGMNIVFHLLAQSELRITAPVGNDAAPHWM